MDSRPSGIFIIGIALLLAVVGLLWAGERIRPPAPRQIYDMRYVIPQEDGSNLFVEPGDWINFFNEQHPAHWMRVYHGITVDWRDSTWLSPMTVRVEQETKIIHGISDKFVGPDLASQIWSKYETLLRSSPAHAGISVKRVGIDRVVWWPGALSNALKVALLLLGCWCVFSSMRIWRRRFLGRCVGCGYDISAGGSTRCPECGRLYASSTPIARADLDDY